jgi:hypothetical protein
MDVGRQRRDPRHAEVPRGHRLAQSLPPRGVA